MASIDPTTSQHGSIVAKIGKNEGDNYEAFVLIPLSIQGITTKKKKEVPENNPKLLKYNCLNYQKCNLARLTFNFRK